MQFFSLAFGAWGGRRFVAKKFSIRKCVDWIKAPLVGPRSFQCPINFVFLCRWIIQSSISMNKFVNWPELLSSRRLFTLFFRISSFELGSRRSASVCHLQSQSSSSDAGALKVFDFFLSLTATRARDLQMENFIAPKPNWLCKRMSISYMCNCHKDMKNFYNFVSVNYIADKSVIETIAKWKTWLCRRQWHKRPYYEFFFFPAKKLRQKRQKKKFHIETQSETAENTVNLAGCVQCRFRYVDLMQFSQVKWAKRRRKRQKKRRSRLIARQTELAHWFCNGNDCVRYISILGVILCVSLFSKHTCSGV